MESNVNCVSDLKWKVEHKTDHRAACLSQNKPVVVRSLLIEPTWKQHSSRPHKGIFFNLSWMSAVPLLQPIHDFHLSLLSKDAGRWKGRTADLHFWAIYSDFTDSVGQLCKIFTHVVKELKYIRNKLWTASALFGNKIFQDCKCICLTIIFNHKYLIKQ